MADNNSMEISHDDDDSPPPPIPTPTPSMNTINTTTTTIATGTALSDKEMDGADVDFVQVPVQGVCPACGTRVCLVLVPQHTVDGVSSPDDDDVITLPSCD